MSSCKATESFCFVHTMQCIYEEDKKSALEHLGRQAMFKFWALWSVRDGKGLMFSAMYVCTICQVIPTKVSDIWYQNTTLKEHNEFIDFQQPFNIQNHPHPRTPAPGPQVWTDV